MPRFQFTMDVSEELAAGVTDARLRHNASILDEIPDPSGELVEDDDGNEVPKMIPNPELIATDVDYCVKRFGQALVSWKQQKDARTPAPSPAPAPLPTGEPTSCTRKQGLKALAMAATLGLPAPIYEGDVEAKIAALPAATDEEKQFKAFAEIEFRTAQVWIMGNPYFDSMVDLFGFTAAQTKALVKLANTFTN